MKTMNPRRCEWCTFETLHRSALSTHRKRCTARPAAVDPEKEQLRQLVAQQAQQLAEKQRIIDELLQAAKDERKRPRSVTNNQTNNINNQINIFGKESLQHVTESKLQELLSDPDTSVARHVTLKHSVDENRNVRVPNCREKWVEVLTERDGVKQWEAVEKNTVLSELVESTALQLEGEADEATMVGQRFVKWHERLLESADQNGRMYREQCDKVHKSLVDATRR